MMTKPKLQGNLAVLIVNIIFGLNIPISKSLMDSGAIDPAGLTLARVLFACAAFWITSFFVEQEKVAWKDLGMLALGGLLGIAGNQLAFIEGLSMTSSVDASIIATVTPILVMIIAAFVLREPITLMKASGVLIGAAGALIIILQGVQGPVSGNIWGRLLCICSGLSYAVYLVIIKPVTMKYSPVTIMKWMFLFAAVLITPFGIGDLMKFGSTDTLFNPDVFLRLFFTLFGATYCTYLLIPYALQRIRPTTLSMYNYIQPIVAASIAILYGQDSFTWMKGLAALLVFVGVYFVTQSKSRADIESEEENVATQPEKIKD
jgi:drug/metabolite transporter (DMT)-like permease